MRASTLLRTSLLLAAVGAASGCVTMSLLPEVGERRDERPVLERAVATNDSMLVFSRVTTTSRDGGVIAYDVPRWSRIDHPTLSWLRLTEVRDRPGPCRKVGVERTPRPEVTMPPQVEVPILPVSGATVVGASRGSQSLIELARPYPISVHPRLTHGMFTIVQHDPSDPATLRDADVCLAPSSYDAWWAMPARVALAPVTIAADAATFPVQVGLLVLLFVDGPNWHW